MRESVCDACLVINPKTMAVVGCAFLQDNASCIEQAPGGLFLHLSSSSVWIGALFVPHSFILLPLIELTCMHGKGSWRMQHVQRRVTGQIFNIGFMFDFHNIIVLEASACVGLRTLGVTIIEL